MKKKVVEPKREIGRKVTPKKKNVYNVLKTAKTFSDVENSDRIEDRVVKSHTKIRSHEELST